MKTETTYVAEDGTRFDSEQECREYEARTVLDYDLFKIPMLTEDTMYGDSEIAFDEIRECLETIAREMSNGNPDAQKAVLALAAEIRDNI